jgi:hypothetical protein
MTAPPNIPPAWANQTLILYHGTIDIHVPSILNQVILSKGRIHTDFGLGFYTTTIYRQAFSWAWVYSRRRPRTKPAVVAFEVNRDDLAHLQALWFVRPAVDADDFWSLIFHCRSGKPLHARTAPQTTYDLVIGPAAASWKQRLALYDTDQVSFHSPQAINLLNSCPRWRVP